MTIHPTTMRRAAWLRTAATGALALLLGTAAVAVATPASATTPTPNLPQVPAAQAAANWLAAQITPGGYIASTTVPGTADLDATANAVFALASAGVDTVQAMSALTYLEAHVDDYVTVSSADGPGQLALLILDAQALGVSPRSFGGSDLVARLLATQQTTGADTGLFGTQDPSFDGAYRQGLSLAALATAGVTSGAAVTSADTWLVDQQCPDGGWTSYISSSNPCDGKPASYTGPDTNSTALAVEGLEAQHALTASAAKAVTKFLSRAEDSDGGWGYEPNSPVTPGSTDPDSTALVLQALVSLGALPSSTKFARGGNDPVATLLGFQITSGPDAGALVFPGFSGPNLLATYQAAPALAGVSLAYDLGTPAVTKLGPTHGVPAGGTTVHLKGTGLLEAESVTFGTTPATSFTIDSSTSITAVAPAGSAGTVDVRVVTPTGTSPAVAGDRFTYKG
jgi:hypothetical protein